MGNGITNENPEYSADPKSYGFERMGQGDSGAIEKSYLESSLPFMQKREERAGKRLSARSAAMGITDDPASQKLYAETVEEPYAREETALRAGAKGAALGMKERDIGRWNTILGELTGRGFQREERLGGEAFRTGERTGIQEFQTGERLGAQAHDIATQEGAQEWQATADALNRQLQTSLAQLNFYMEEGQYFNFDYDDPDFFGTEARSGTTPFLGYTPGQGPPGEEGPSGTGPIGEVERRTGIRLPSGTSFNPENWSF